MGEKNPVECCRKETFFLRFWTTVFTPRIPDQVHVLAFKPVLTSVEDIAASLCVAEFVTSSSCSFSSVRMRLPLGPLSPSPSPSPSLSLSLSLSLTLSISLSLSLSLSLSFSLSLHFSFLLFHSLSLSFSVSFTLFPSPLSPLLYFSRFPSVSQTLYQPFALFISLSLSPLVFPFLLVRAKSKSTYDAQLILIKGGLRLTNCSVGFCLYSSSC